MEFVFNITYFPDCGESYDRFVVEAESQEIASQKCEEFATKNCPRNSLIETEDKWWKIDLVKD